MPHPIDEEHHLPVEVYIGDTDAYAMVYHATYLRFFARAREDFFGLAALSALARGEEALRLRDRGVRHVRYFDSARFGDELVVESKIIELGESHAVFNHILRRKGEPKEKKVLRCVAEVGFAAADGSPRPLPAALVSPDAAKGLPPCRDSTVFGGAPPPLGAAAASATPHRLRVHAWGDLVLATGTLCQVQLVDLLERSRTALLGGPAVLERCRLDATIFVVSRIDGVRHAADARHGDALDVCSVVELRSGGRCVVFHEELRRGEELLSEGRVSVFCIDSNTREPKPCPEEVQRGLAPHTITR